MNTEAKRRQFRKRLVDLSDVELVQWMFLCNLALKVEAELACYVALWPPSTDEQDAPDTQLATIQLLIAQELKRRSNAGAKTKAKVKRLQSIETMEGENHADHVQANGNA